MNGLRFTERTLLQRNVEIKARCSDLADARETSVAHGARPMGYLIQTDTYFVVPRGRLKLRETIDLADELIYYNRPDSTDPKPSDYWLVRVGDAIFLKALLTAALGVRAVVRKRRELLLWQNVRIHLDQVENLGNFLELEAVVSPDADETVSRSRLTELRGALRIGDDNLLASSYADMLTAKLG